MVKSAADLAKIRLRQYSYYCLNSDLDLSGISWTVAIVPMFRGFFDGQGHVISNVVINRPGSDYVGLFGFIGEGVQVENLGIEDANIAGRWCVGGLCGENDGNISNCCATGAATGDKLISGFCGANTGGTISACCAAIEVISNDCFSGGLCGANYNGVISDCYASGAVTGHRLVGGVCGYNCGGTINNCYATGEVMGDMFVGGMCGQNIGIITDSFCSSGGNSIITPPRKNAARARCTGIDLKLKTNKVIKSVTTGMPARGEIPRASPQLKKTSDNRK